MDYYYLQGADKIGPISEEQLRALKLPSETLIYGGEFIKWTPISEFPIKSKEAEFNPPSEVNKGQQPLGETQRTKKIRVSATMLLVVGIVVSVFFSYLYVQNKKNNDLTLFQSKIANVFHNKTEICDYEKERVEGTLRKSNPNDPLDDDDKELNEIFELENGGFKVYKLTTKTSDKFEKTVLTSKNLGYKVPSQRYNPGYFGYGYYSSSQRGEVRDVYKEAMEYLSSDNKTYEEGSLDQIKSFNAIKTDFYRLKSDYRASTSGSGWVFNNKWIVWYKSEQDSYEVEENSEHFFMQVALFAIIFSAICFGLYLLYKYQKRVQVQIN